MIIIKLTPCITGDDLTLLVHQYSVCWPISDQKHTHTPASFLAAVKPLWSWEGHVCNDVMLGGWAGGRGGYIEMLMSPHSGGDSWRATEEWRNVSPHMNHRGKATEGCRVVIHPNQCPPGCWGVCVCVWSSFSPLKDKVKKTKWNLHKS